MYIYIHIPIYCTYMYIYTCWLSRRDPRLFPCRFINRRRWTGVASCGWATRSSNVSCNAWASPCQSVLVGSPGWIVSLFLDDHEESLSPIYIYIWCIYIWCIYIWCIYIYDVYIYDVYIYMCVCACDIYFFVYIYMCVCDIHDLSEFDRCFGYAFHFVWSLST